ncbi:MAG: DUF2309 domain-containing protein [Oscillochloris sp.]|nr:DUF2309 domain-containing protein [Oscillochloris sp.]
MLKVTTRTATELRTDSILDDAATVIRRIPPLWDLSNYVAVNPFLGFSSQPLPEAAHIIVNSLGARILPEISFYRQRWLDGAFGEAELATAAERADQAPEALQAILSGESPTPLRSANPTRTFAELHDLHFGTTWNERILRHTTLWCAAHISAVAASGTPIELYSSWREAALVDRSLEIAGLPGWRAFIARLPEHPAAALTQILSELGVEPEERPAYLYRLLGSVFGWASYLRRDVWAAGDQDLGPLLDLLAIRICSDAAVSLLAPQKTGPAAVPPPAADNLPPGSEDETVRMIFQEALENGFANRLIAQLNGPTPASGERPAVQAAFCIDVRSEVLRRHLESQSPRIETRGFAGFFGVFLNWQSEAGGSARCPVLLPTGVTIRSQQAPEAFSARTVLKKIASAPAASFSFVETLGLGYALGLAGDALGRLIMPRAAEAAAPFTLDPAEAAGVVPNDRITMAAGILKNLGLREQYGRIVLLCGHEGRSENNPHQAGLDCGACGGHGGALNARVACALLNDPAVRAALPAQGFPVPTDTHFLPGVHDTSTDEVHLLDLDQLPATHGEDLKQLRKWLAAAGVATRAERAAAMGIAPQPEGMIAKLLNRRARDWSEVRPEWALARNAAFIVARRSRTRSVNLEGRAFLHEYDWHTDPDNSILTLILTAP